FPLGISRTVASSNSSLSVSLAQLVVRDDDRPTMPAVPRVHRGDGVRGRAGAGEEVEDNGVGRVVRPPNLGISWGLVLTGGMNRERCSWPGMIRGVEARIDPAEGAPFRCLTL